jgi:hypothetical protein
MEIPESMKSEFAAWNNGGGIDLKGGVNCEGRFSLAVGYASIFWPQFVEFEAYTPPYVCCGRHSGASKAAIADSFAAVAATRFQ